jgi:hypothetical protein
LPLIVTVTLFVAANLTVAVGQALGLGTRDRKGRHRGRARTVDGGRVDRDGIAVWSRQEHAGEGSIDRPDRAIDQLHVPESNVDTGGVKVADADLVGRDPDLVGVAQEEPRRQLRRNFHPGIRPRETGGVQRTCGQPAGAERKAEPEQAEDDGHRDQELDQTGPHLSIASPRHAAALLGNVAETT